MLSLGALGSGLLVMVRLFFGWWWWFRQGVKGLALEPNHLQGVYLSLVHVLVLIKSSWDNITVSLNVIADECLQERTPLELVMVVC